MHIREIRKVTTVAPVRLELQNKEEEEEDKKNYPLFGGRSMKYNNTNLLYNNNFGSRKQKKNRKKSSGPRHRETDNQFISFASREDKISFVFLSERKEIVNSGVVQENHAVNVTFPAEFSITPFFF